MPNRAAPHEAALFQIREVRHETETAEAMAVPACRPAPPPRSGRLRPRRALLPRLLEASQRTNAFAPATGAHIPTEEPPEL